MVTAYLRAGLVAGVAGGAYAGGFVATVGRAMIDHAETFEAGGAEASVTETTAAVASVAGAVVWGLVLGVAVFGLGYYVLEPALPVAPDTRSYLLGAAGFVTVSGSPWLAFPPLPPGVESSLPIETRLLWYGVFVLAGGIACGLAGWLYFRRPAAPRPTRLLVALLPFGVIGLALLAAPAESTQGSLSPAFATAFRWSVVFGQVGLWVVLASAHAWVVRRGSPGPAAPPTGSLPGAVPAQREG